MFRMFSMVLIVYLVTADEDEDEYRRPRYITVNGFPLSNTSFSHINVLLRTVSVSPAGKTTKDKEGCVVGAELMHVPPGKKRPSPCPPFKDARGVCWMGDMGLRAELCLSMYGQELYSSMPEAVEHPQDV